jgi:hypothetical protein
MEQASAHLACLRPGDPAMSRWLYPAVLLLSVALFSWGVLPRGVAAAAPPQPAWRAPDAGALRALAEDLRTGDLDARFRRVAEWAARA